LRSPFQGCNSPARKTLDARSKTICLTSRAFAHATPNWKAKLPKQHGAAGLKNSVSRTTFGLGRASLSAKSSNETAITCSRFERRGQELEPRIRTTRTTRALPNLILGSSSLTPSDFVRCGESLTPGQCGLHQNRCDICESSQGGLSAMGIFR
jgi:hypothetical protein